MMFLHGGPEGQGRPGYNEFFPPLLEAGITVFLPNVRGSGGFGRSFMHADDREQRFAAIDDVADAALFLVERGLAPADRVACCGWSYGGYLTQAALTFHPQLFAAGISICGMSDLNTWYRNTEPWIAAAAYSKYGHPVSDRELLDQLSPLLRAHALTAPLLLVHGLNDTNVPPSESQQMFDALRALGRTVEQLLFDDDGHEIDKRENRAVLVKAMSEWLTTAFVRRTELLNRFKIGSKAFTEIVRGVKPDLRQVGAQQEEASMRGGGILGVIVLVWLLIGVVAAYQRDYFKTDANNCATAGTIALTVVAGPLNYAGVEPEGDGMQRAASPASNQRAQTNSSVIETESSMIVLGVILLILDSFSASQILTYIGVVLIVIGAVFWILGSTGRAVGGRRALVLTPSRRVGRPRTGAATVIARKIARDPELVPWPADLAVPGLTLCGVEFSRPNDGVRHQPRVGFAVARGPAAEGHRPRSRRTAVAPCGPDASRARAGAPDRGPGCGSDRTRRARNRDGSRSARPARSRRRARRPRLSVAPASSRVLMPTSSSTSSASLLGKCR